jgi:hypothetical protein
VPKPDIVLREEADGWGLLFDLETSVAMGLNSTGVFIWKYLDGKRNIRAIIQSVKASFSCIPESLDKQIADFIESLKEKQFVSY